MADFLDEKRSEIAARLNELKPLVAEYERLVAAAAALGDVAAASAPAPAAARRPRKRTANASASASVKPANASTGPARRGRPKGSGTRAKEALQIVRDNPGITIPGIADRMGIKQNYLYRVLPGLEEDGLVSKDGRSWYAKNSA